MSILSALAVRLKSALGPTPGGDPYLGGRYGSWSALLPSTRIDYQTEAGDLLANSIIAACVQWIGRTFPEAPLRVMRRAAAGGIEVPAHPLTLLLRGPNPAYNGLLLWAATLASLNVSGNGYWLKVRASTGKLAEVWYEPDFTCRPAWDTNGIDFISHYQVRRAGQWLDVPKENIVHFRAGLDPRNPRLGLSPLASALREVFSDNEAANFSAALLRNMGIPGIVVSPAAADTTIADPQGLKNTLISKFSGDRRGEPLVMEGPTKIDILSFSPDQLNLEKLRNIPEERITALLGIPAIVAGMGSGLDHAIYSNVVQAREAAYHNNLLPTQRLLAAQLDIDLLPEFGTQTDLYTDFDISKVQALAADQNLLYERLSKAYLAGWITRAEARTMAADTLPNDPDDDVYFTQLIRRAERITVVDPAGAVVPEAAPQGDAPGGETMPTTPTQPPEPAAAPKGGSSNGTHP